MNEQDFIKIKEDIRQYAFISAKRKKFEEFKKILINRIMKEISATEKLNIAEQKKEALKRIEYKNLLKVIKELGKIEGDYYWKINKFITDSESYAVNAQFDRSNNWNIHNI